MKTYQYNELGKELPDGSIENVVITITEKEIIELYYTYWCIRMEKARLEHLISEENCIQDWIIINWAWEVKDNV